MPSPPRGRTRSETRRLREAHVGEDLERNPSESETSRGERTLPQLYPQEARGPWDPKGLEPHAVQSPVVESRVLPQLSPLLGAFSSEQGHREGGWPPTFSNSDLGQPLGALEGVETTRDAGADYLRRFDTDLERSSTWGREETVLIRTPEVEHSEDNQSPTFQSTIRSPTASFGVGVDPLSLELGSKTLAKSSKPLASSYLGLATPSHTLPTPSLGIGWADWSEESTMNGEKWTFSGEEGSSLTFRKFKMKFESERSGVYEKLPPLQPGDAAGKLERELNDFKALPRYLSGLALERFEQDSEGILAPTKVMVDQALEAAVDAAKAKLGAVKASKPNSLLL